ncbi:hypothetical protein TrCOL_g5941 [Triparma columacea]|uniref:Phosphodiester glycosidase domain-containing protein n=1 Tax=Triparma columacea TaxID=722753 RepID=A0A9W7LCK3_9STRA|nr:hypothetical protein TrCOL_g5941 [Triparma columacea]
MKASSPPNYHLLLLPLLLLLQNLPSTISSCIPFLIPPQSQYVELAVTRISCKLPTEVDTDVIYYTFEDPRPNNITLDEGGEQATPNSDITVRGAGLIPIYLQSYSLQTSTYTSPVIPTSVTIYSLQVTLTLLPLSPLPPNLMDRNGVSPPPPTPPPLNHDSPLLKFTCSRPSEGTVILYTLDSTPPTPTSPNATCGDTVRVEVGRIEETVEVKAYTTTNGKGDSGPYVQEGSLQTFPFTWVFPTSYTIPSPPSTLPVSTTRFRFTAGPTSSPHHPTGVISTSPSVIISSQQDVALGGHKGPQAKVKDTAKRQGCKVAMNGGFFNTDNGETIGNYRLTDSDGEQITVLDPTSHKNVGIGLLKTGTIYIGYNHTLSPSPPLSSFTWYLQGCIWLIKNGQPYVDISGEQEDMTVQTTGMPRFLEVNSARTAVCVKEDGRVDWIAVEGKTDVYGIDLYTFSTYLSTLDYSHCVNLDGGGSVSVVYDSTVDLITPGYECAGEGHYYKERCAKKISTMTSTGTPNRGNVGYKGDFDGDLEEEYDWEKPSPSVFKDYGRDEGEESNPFSPNTYA